MTRLAGSMTFLPFTVTRPARISARASDRLAKPSLDSARSSETVPRRQAELAVARSPREAPLAVVAKLERDAEILGAQRLHRVLQIVL